MKKKKNDIVDVLAERISEIVTEKLMEHFGERLDEMPTLTREITGLEQDIWLDGGGINQQPRHADRVKFQPDEGITDSHYYASIRLDNFEVIGNYNHKFVDSREMRRIQGWCKANSDNIRKVRKQQMDLRDEFIPNIVRVDNNGNPIINNRIKNFTIVPNTENYGINTVKSDDGKYNYVDENGKLLSDKWFDSAITFGKIIGNNGQCGRVVINGCYFDLFRNGKFRFVSKDNKKKDNKKKRK